MNNEEKIIICEECKGTGYNQRGDKCPVCSGQGRLLRSIIVSDNIIDDENLKRKAMYG